MKMAEPGTCRNDEHDCERCARLRRRIADLESILRMVRVVSAVALDGRSVGADEGLPLDSR